MYVHWENLEDKKLPVIPKAGTSHCVIGLKTIRIRSCLEISLSRPSLFKWMKMVVETSTWDRLRRIDCLSLPTACIISIFSGILDKELKVSTFDENFMVILRKQFISPNATEITSFLVVMFDCNWYLLMTFIQLVFLRKIRTLWKKSLSFIQMEPTLWKLLKN